MICGLALSIVLPLVGRYTSQEEHGDGHPEIGRGGVDPDLDGEGLEEGEWAGWRRKLLLV